ncbi:MAG: DNA-binding MarR family transcriptional regulator [Desulforhopalus sp.]
MQNNSHVSGGLMDEKITQEQAVTQQLRIIFKAVQAHSKTVEKVCGLSSAQLWMLYEVSEAPGVKVSQLAKTLVIHPSTCSNMLDKLEAKELISRDRSKTDQRSVHLFMTDMGKVLLKNAPVPPQGKLSEALERLSVEQIKKLQCGLEDLITGLNVKDDNQGLTPIPIE